MVTITSDWVEASAGTAVITAAVTSVSPGTNRRVIAVRVGANAIRFVGYDIA